MTHNPSAFPILPPLDNGSVIAPGYPYPESGMSLRDWFAGQAMAALTVNRNFDSLSWEQTAALAYSAADEMLKARQEGG